MSSILSLLGDPLSNLVSAASGIIGKFVADPEAKIAANIELAKIQAEFQNKALDADIAFAASQRDVIVAEAKSESWAARNWRPLIMLMFGYIIFHNYIIAQIFSLRILPIPDDLWSLMKLGLGGYVFGRTAEKLAPHVTDAIAAAKTKDDDT